MKRMELIHPISTHMLFKWFIRACICEPNMVLTCVFDLKRLTNLDFIFNSVIQRYKKCGVLQFVVELSFRTKVWMLSGRTGEVSSWELVIVSWRGGKELKSAYVVSWLWDWSLSILRWRLLYPSKIRVNGLASTVEVLAELRLSLSQRQLVKGGAAQRGGCPQPQIQVWTKIWTSLLVRPLLKSLTCAHYS